MSLSTKDSSSPSIPLITDSLAPYPPLSPPPLPQPPSPLNPSISTSVSSLVPAPSSPSSAQMASPNPRLPPSSPVAPDPPLLPPQLRPPPQAPPARLRCQRRPPPRPRASNPNMLSRNLNNHLKLLLDLLSFSSSLDDLLLAVHRNRWFPTCNLRRTLLPNITLLISGGVPNSHISKLLATHPSVLMQSHDHFAEAVGTAERLGERPNLSLFIHAVQAVDKGCEAGDAEGLRLVGGGDWCCVPEEGTTFLASFGEVKWLVDFLVNTVGLGQVDLSLQPKLLMYSLEKDEDYAKVCCV